jgi:hypothetical protein
VVLENGVGYLIFTFLALVRALLHALHVPSCKASSKAKSMSPWFTTVPPGAPRFQCHAALPSRR